ncbi:MAG: TRAP transporter substrate-binding protein DctP [Gammaproteobacteria bacterium]|nr:TRAP transporter substrate-binding protein DctP [Gammaproteobacteria bacterium]
MKKLFYIIPLIALSLGFSPSNYALTLKIATIAPAGTNWMKQMKKGAKEIKKKTNNRVKIKFYPGGVMGNDQSVHRKIRINQLQGGAFSSSGMSNIDPSIQVLSLPMVFKSFAEVDYVRKVMDERVKKHVAQNGFIVLGISEGGFARIMSNKEINTIQDIRDSKVWIPEGDDLVYETFKTMGISPIPLPLADVFTGLQTGLIETIASTSTGAIAFQWHTKLTHMVDIPVLYVIGILAVNQKAFNKIKADDQKIVIDEMSKVFSILEEINRQDNISATAALKTQGLKVITPTDEEIQIWQDFSDKSIQNMIQNGMIDKALMDDIHKLLVEFRK